MAAEAAIGLVLSRLARNLQASANPQALLPGCCLGATVVPRHCHYTAPMGNAPHGSSIMAVPWYHRGSKPEGRGQGWSRNRVMRHGWRNSVCHFGTKGAESAKSGLIWAPSQRVGSKSTDLLDEAACSRWTQTDLVFHRKQRRTLTTQQQADAPPRVLPYCHGSTPVEPSVTAPMGVGGQ